MSDSSDQTETLAGDQRRHDADGAAPTASVAAEPRAVLVDRYRLDELVARGGMATVWRAHDAVLARTVAVKVLHDHLVADEGFRERFRREAVSAAKLTHPHIVGVYDTGTDDSRVFLVMEFVEGTTLKELIAEHGRLDPHWAAQLGQQIADALAYAHSRGLVHRDVKPANILVGADGEAKIADFGIAKAEEAGDDLTQTGTVLGTAAYVAPEQLSGESLDGKADMYALGCVLYEALTGIQPFTAETAMATAVARLNAPPPFVRDAVAEAPPELEAVVARAMARRPEDRFADSGELASALAAAGGVSTVPANPVTPGVAADPWTDETGVDEPRHHAPSRQARRRRWLLPALVAAMVAALLGVGMMTGQLDVFDTNGAPQTADGDAEPLEPVEVTLFDPEGGDSEQGNAGDLANLLDGDPTTEWSSVGYNDAQFAGLKSGLGFWVDLGAPHALDRVRLATSTPGIDLELRTADEPGSDPGDWEVIESVADAPEEIDVDLDGITTQYVLVWVTGDLQQVDDANRHRVRFAELAVEGSP